MGPALRLMWADFRTIGYQWGDPEPDEPVAPSTLRDLARVAVLLLRPVLMLVVYTPFGWTFWLHVAGK